jgi:hydrogenase maturation protease
MSRVLVLGLGNVLMGDDAFGPFVIQALNAGYEFPPGVAVLDGGTPGLNLLPLVIDTGILIVIDTVRSRGDPGELRFYSKSELCRARPSARQGPHDPGLDEVLTALDLAGRAPSEAVLIGVIPGRSEAGIGLSPPLLAAVPAAVDAVIARLRDFGFSARPRENAAPAAPWWETAIPPRSPRPA